MDIFVSKGDGAEPRRLTSARGYDAEGAYSPDGRTIVFASTRSGYQGELSEADRRRLESDPSYFAEIYVMDADGAGVKRLTESPGYDGGPFFSADGAWIVWRRFDPDGLIARLEGAGYRATARLQTGALMAAGDYSAGVALRGLEVARDATVSLIGDKIK